MHMFWLYANTINGDKIGNIFKLCKGFSYGRFFVPSRSDFN